MKKKIKKLKRYMMKFKSGYEVLSVSALINGVKYTFTKDSVFNSIGEIII